jgi:hypothetical protein
VTLMEILDSGDLEGYRQGLPPHSPVGLCDGAAIDAQVCADSRCSACGHAGLSYEPFVNVEPTERSGLTGRPRYSYRAFAICPACGLAEEF